LQRVFVQSFGCRASQADGAAIEASLEDGGYMLVAELAAADLVVLNTCTVTHNADVENRRLVRSLHRANPQAGILVTGCHAQRAPQELAALPGVRWVVGNTHKTEIAQLLYKSSEAYHSQILTAEIATATAFHASPVRGIREDRTRPNLKVQDGCSNRCSFCIIPSVRGRSRSASLESVVEQMHVLAAKYCEVVLTGINLGRWGRDLPDNSRFVDLVRAILLETPIRRLRLSSVEPMDWSSDLLELFAAEPRLARHIHLPLQSGSDAVLKRMFRKYRTRHYAGRVQLARQLLPDAAIGADVMTGFPGETDQEFSETVRFIEEQPFTYLHVFTYSERPSTSAAIASHPVPAPVRQERTRVLRQLGARKNLAFRQAQLGKRLSAVTLEKVGTALTSNFLPVQLSAARPPNMLIEVPIEGLTESGLREQSAFPILQRL